jgi:16S rRNA (adenine1518-N6/adenine1519-N6)-dimethyltransferase
VPRQTQSYLRTLFARRGIAPRHRLGQNFLIDLNIHDLIVEQAGVGPRDVVLEVGPGAGALTSLMASRGASVIAVEVDPNMAALAREAVVGLTAADVRVLNVDALANKNTLNPEVLAAVRAALDAGPDRRLKLVANLPYNVATPIITNLLVHPDLCPALMVVTIQRELAERMIAAPGTPDYGSLAILVQALADVSIVRNLPPTVFWPRPKVDSAVVAIRPDPVRRADLDVSWFHKIVRKIFLQRRKNLRGVLSRMWEGRWTKADVDAWLGPIGIDGDLRAEALGVDQFRLLSQTLKERWGAAPEGEDREVEPDGADHGEDVIATDEHG